MYATVIRVWFSYEGIDEDNIEVICMSTCQHVKMETLIKNIIALNSVKEFSTESRESFYRETRSRVEQHLKRGITNEEFDSLLTFSQDAYDFMRKEDPLVSAQNLIYPSLDIVQAMLQEGYKVPTCLENTLRNIDHHRQRCRAQTC